MPIEGASAVDIREAMALRAMDDRYTITEVAELFGVSRPTVRLWRDRYREGGREGLDDRSHAPHSCPHRTGRVVEDMIVAERLEHGWGSKKILQRLKDHHPDLTFPPRSTVDEVLKRNGLVDQNPRPRRPAKTPFRQRYVPTDPGELMTVDHKGEFRLGNGKYCYPLTIVDSVSRYILACEALRSTRFEETWPMVEATFRKHGLPVAMQSDNGPPFGSSVGRVSLFSVRLMALGILPVFGRPGRPQDNGKHERMHRDIKREATRPPGRSIAEQQDRFDEFVVRYNVERPHEGIDLQRPATIFRDSPRPFPKRRRRPEYAGHLEPRKVTADGYIKWKSDRIFVGQPLGGWTVALEPTADALCSVHFFDFVIGKIDERTVQFI